MSRLTKMLVMAALAAVTATAFIGAGSASASVHKRVLCKVLQKLCTSANLWAPVSGHVTIKALSTKARLLSGIIPVTCHSETTVLVEKFLLETIDGRISSLLWTNCSTCPTVTTTTLPTGELKGLTGDVSTLLTTSQTVVLLKGCPFGAECTAKASDVSLEFTGGTIGGTATAKANEVPTTVEGGILCGSSGKWDAGSGESNPYVVTSVNGITSGSIFISPESHA
jgi:hypothetical protein